ncbi:MULTISPECIES: hypothetical protein [Caulobacter]|jgi:hypothetical protein|uniref:Uncharacterized protein n=1 Tax=Caulobacter rhizosphaerae TaxID=2010972 RepID=A0ABU1MZC6_9CAUL|nr:MULTISPECIES: hypothetical protein [Caulobacter]KQZ18359.1 hypothetical protein ASD47_10560 [Caulobacter sp. Root1472]MDR6531530.1 hypothetical protein [Caulobacter rhizosphaerae]GGL37950.1 hypothetical protein GCM10010983_38800 [Caulobacter rhizosphaerae]
MPPSASPQGQHADASPAKAAWLAGPARSLRKLIGQGPEGSSGRDWAASPKVRQKSRRPVWE